ncbi:MAG TPA: UvrD-helicase domain-containing protein [Verrucomicrobiae bacterium]|nr:UvrD-helicase domain-containing protein [Verrucomicrobiae bacterium]
MTSPTGAALDPARSVSLQASAGSGKTWQLVSRVLRMLLEGAEPGGILALTFTRKAAIEMRLRLNERLRVLADADDAVLDAELALLGLAPTPALRQHARSLYTQLLFAAHPPRAMTLHAFCQELLERFALEARVPPGFALFENEEELAERAWRRVQARMNEEPDGAAARALAELVRFGLNEWTLRELVTLFLARRGDWWAYTEGQPDPAAYATERLRGQLGDCDLDAAIAQVDSHAFVARLRMLQNYLEKTGGTQYLKPAPLAFALLQQGLDRYDGIEDALFSGKGTPYTVRETDSKLKRLSNQEREHFFATLAEVLREFEPMRKRRHAGEALARSAAAFTLGEAALEALRAELARERALGFTELEWHTCRLLARDGAADWVRHRLDARIDHLLIDEFQDTSPTQWRMLLPLLEEMAAGDGGRRRSLFIVGDAKQSIYGFRRADPRLLGRATEWMKEKLGAGSEPLHHSRRSAQPVIDFVNALYAIEGLGQRIGFEVHGTHRASDWGRVEIALPVTDDAIDAAPRAGLRDPLREAREAREDRRAQDEARLVSARIRELVASGIEVTASRGPRAIGWGDVMVLARARTHLHHLERQLTADGVPFVGAARGTLLETSIARDLTALLRLLDAPHRNLELAQVLRSPLFGAPDEMLAQIAQEARAQHTPWLDAVARLSASVTGPHAPLLRRAHELIARWRELAARLPAHDLIDRIARDADVAARYEQALPRVTGARARANLGAVLQLALEADSGRYPSLPRFLEWLRAQGERFANAPDEPPPAAAAEQVRIMTIHAAKGLEAPAVFLVNAGSYRNPGTPRLLIEWPEHEPRPTHFMVAGAAARLDELGRRLAEDSKAREAREELNVLYVAATRARQFLHVSGFVGQGKKSWHALAIEACKALAPAPAWTGTAIGSRAYGSAEPPRGRPANAPPLRAAVDPRLRVPLTLATPEELAPSERVAADPYDSAAAAARGTALHLLLQRLSEGASDELALWQEVCARLEAEPAREDFAQWLADARAVLAAPELAPFFDPARHAKAWNEVPVGVDGTTAVLDRLVDDGTIVWVIDYKTHGRPDVAALAERYRAQLAAYAGAVRGVWPGREVRAGLVLTATRRWVPVIGSEA